MDAWDSSYGRLHDKQERNRLSYKAAGNWYNLLVYKLSVKFKKRFLKTYWPFGANALRVEYITGVLLLHEFSSPNEFSISCCLLVTLCVVINIFICYIYLHCIHNLFIVLTCLVAFQMLTLLWTFHVVKSKQSWYRVV